MPLEQAQERLLALAPALPKQTLDLRNDADSTGSIAGIAQRYLAQDHHALRTQPAADLSAMDGYALCGDGPWELVGESRAGAPLDGALTAGQCTRISTGAHMPSGADRVLIQEDAVREDERVEATEQPSEGQHIRRAGLDFSEGDTVLRAGDPVTPAAIALAIAAGHASLEVVAPPRVAVLDSGDELVPVGQRVEPHRIPASNGAMLAAMLARLVGTPERIGPVGDSMEALGDALRLAEDCHVLVTSGGASVGDHDLVRAALEDWGARIDFWKVAVKPGKPLMVATREADWGRQVILGLPGNPVSSFVTAQLFALPLVRKAMGAASPLPHAHRLVAAETLPSTGPRREFLRGVSDGVQVHLASSQDSSALLSLARANCLIDRPAGSVECAPGETVMAYNLQSG